MPGKLKTGGHVCFQGCMPGSWLNIEQPVSDPGPVSTGSLFEKLLTRINARL